MNNQKSAEKYLRKVVKSCRNGVLHPQIEYELLNELVNLLKAAQQSVQADEAKKAGKIPRHKHTNYPHGDGAV